MRCFKKTQSGAVCEIEVFSMPDGVKLTKKTEPKPVNVRTDEVREALCTPREYQFHQCGVLRRPYI